MQFNFYSFLFGSSIDVCIIVLGILRCGKGNRLNWDSVVSRQYTLLKYQISSINILKEIYERSYLRPIKIA